MGVRCVGAILAGGASSRFGGAPKGLSLVAGERIIDRVARALAGAADEMVLASSLPGADQWLPGIRVVPDLRPERASMVGIDAALAYAGCPVLVVGWDMPFVGAELLRHLRAAGERGASPAVVVGARGIEGCCAYYTPDCRPVIADLLSRGQFRLGQLIDAMPASARVPASEIAKFGDPARLFFNVNSASDLATAGAMASGAPLPDRPAG